MVDKQPKLITNLAIAVTVVTNLPVCLVYRLRYCIPATINLAEPVEFIADFFHGRYYRQKLPYNASSILVDRGRLRANIVIITLNSFILFVYLLLSHDFYANCKNQR